MMLSIICSDERESMLYLYRLLGRQSKMMEHIYGIDTKMRWDYQISRPSALDRYTRVIFQLQNVRNPHEYFAHVLQPLPHCLTP